MWQMEVCGEQSHRIIEGHELDVYSRCEAEGKEIKNSCFPYKSSRMQAVSGMHYGILDMDYSPLKRRRRPRNIIA